MHLLLALGISGADEAFVIGFTMGNDPKTNGLHLLIFKFFTRFFYPIEYRFTAYQLQIFDRGFLWGRQLKTKNIHRFDFNCVLGKTLGEVRSLLGIDLEELEQLKLHHPHSYRKKEFLPII